QRLGRHFLAAIDEQQVREVVVARRKLHAVAFALLPQEREQDTEERRKVFLDVRRDHALQRRARVDPLYPRVIAGQRDDRFNAVVAQRAFELAIDVGRTQRRDNRAAFPGGELGDYELRRVRHQERHPVAALDAERGERRRARVAESLQVLVGDRRALE